MGREIIRRRKRKAGYPTRNKENKRTATLTKGRFVTPTEGITGNRSLEWLQRSGLKSETEGLIMAAQEQAIRTRTSEKLLTRMRLTVVSKCVVKETKRLPTLFRNVTN